MTDENQTPALNTEAATATPADATAQKKQRAPRKPKAAAEAAVSAPAATVKSPKAPRKKRADAAEAPAIVETPVVAKGKAKTVVKAPRKAKPSNPATKATATGSAASDEFSDLLQLEEENRRLRQALAEKLHAENADLRKRLGA